MSRRPKVSEDLTKGAAGYIQQIFLNLILLFILLIKSLMTADVPALSFDNFLDLRKGTSAPNLFATFAIFLLSVETYIFLKILDFLAALIDQ